MKNLLLAALAVYSKGLPLGTVNDDERLVCFGFTIDGVLVATVMANGQWVTKGEGETFVSFRDGKDLSNWINCFSDISKIVNA